MERVEAVVREGTADVDISFKLDIPVNWHREEMFAHSRVMANFC